MKISPITIKSNQYYKNKRINFYASDVMQDNKVSNSNKDISTEKNQNLKNGLFLGTCLLLPLLLLGLLYKNKGKSFKDIFSSSFKFESLKNDTKVPTLDNCKSINKTLKTYLQQQINHIKANPDILKDAGNPNISNRLLLTGAPGNGKSFFAKIFAKTIDAEYLDVRQSDFNSKWAGEGTANFKRIFESILKEAKKNKDKKYVVCFNEIDAIVQPVETLTNSQGSHGTTLLQHRSVFLNYMEDLKDKVPNVIVIGTTNISPKRNKLDGASLSRFKKIIDVPFPEKDCLFEAIKMNLKNVKDSEVFIKNNEDNLKKLAEDMEKRKFSFRNMEAVIEDAKNIYVTEALENKSKDFKFEYLEKAKNDFTITDGEFKV